jgi:hypothetical protein
MRSFRRVFALLALSSTLLLASLSAAAASPQAAPRVPVHTMPTVGRTRHPHASSPDPIRFHGGSVMTGNVNIYVIWYGDWSPRSRRRAIVTHFLQHLASPYWNINRTFPSASGKVVTATPVLAGQTTDTGSVGKVQVTDAQIQIVVEHAVAAKALPHDSHGIYLVITSTSVSKVGFLSEFCGWHSYAHINRSILKFAFIGDPTGPKIGGCTPQTVSPNGDAGADSMVSTIAHELDETVTDPTFNGWRTDRGEENGDRCAWQYGVMHNAAKGKANIRLGGRDYLVQTNWVNSAQPHCGMTP